MTPTLTRPSTPEPQVWRAGVWTILGFAGAQVFRFAFNLITTHLLVPELFGLMSLVNLVSMGLVLCSDLGTGLSLIREPRGAEPAFRHTAWTIQVFRGAALWLLSAIFSRPVALFYGDARLVWLIPLCGLSAVLAGFNATWLSIAVRQFALRKVVVLDLTAQFLAGLVMVLWAWRAPGVAPLVAGALAGPVVKLVGSHLLADAPDRFGWNRAVYARIAAFGKWIWAGTTLTFLAGQCDRLILAKLIPLGVFGVYGIAATISEMARAAGAALSGNVLYPAYARLAAVSTAELRQGMVHHRGPVLAGFAVLIAALAGCGDVVIRLVYDTRYAAAAPMLPVLALGIWPALLVQTTDPALQAIGKPRYSAFAHAARLLFTAVAVPAAFHLLGLPGAIAAIALNDLPSWAVIRLAAVREHLGGTGQEFRATLFLLLLLGAAALARHMAGLPVWLELPR